MSSKLVIPTLISMFFAFSMASYVYYSLRRENLVVAGQNIGYKFISNHFTGEKIKDVFKKVYSHNQQEIKKVFPDIDNGEKLQIFCEKKSRDKWTSENGIFIIYGLKWCSVPTYMMLGRKNNQIDSEKFKKLFEKPRTSISITATIPGGSGEEVIYDSNKSRALQGVIRGFCNEVLNDAWNFYHESRRNEIDTFCPVNTQLKK